MPDGLRRKLTKDHPTAMAFLDESGSISSDRFFTVGCLKLEEPSRLLRAIQHLRDGRRFYGEFHFAKMKARDLRVYKEAVDVIAANTAGLTFSAFVADRAVADPIERFGDEHSAYEKLAAQLILGTVGREEIVAVLADNYSTPPHVDFEGQVKREVNNRVDRLAVSTVCRLDSRSADPLQMADLFTSAVTREYRENSGLAKPGSFKSALAEHIRDTFGVSTFIGGFRGGPLNVATYEHGRWTPS